ncbi:hypothetical protein DIPPA_32495 [Diplonema papillatum]|nr:hypothetical protein DIPPA_32495 [Diplonema papillatum]
MDRAPVGRWTCTVSRCRVPSTRQITTMYSDSTTAVVENVIKSARPPNRGLSEHNLINPGDKLELNQCPEANSEVTVNEVKYVLERYAADQGTSLHAAQLRYLVSEVVGFEVSAAAAIHVLLAMEVNADRQVSLRELLAFWPGIHAFMMNMRETGQLRASVTPPTLICESMPTESTSLLQASPEYTEETDPVPGEGGNLMSPLERAVFHEINFARTQPVAYAKFIEDEIPHIDSSNILRRPGDIPIRCSEGPAAWREAADELRGIKPLPAIKSAPLGLYLAAKDHVLDQAKGAVGHGGTDGSQPSDRCMRYGRWQVMCGENLSYGMKTGQGVREERLPPMRRDARGVPQCGFAVRRARGPAGPVVLRGHGAVWVQRRALFAARRRRQQPHRPLELRRLRRPRRRGQGRAAAAGGCTAISQAARSHWLRESARAPFGPAD